MLFDETQKEILEYTMDEVYSGADISKASFIMWLIRDTACDVLGLNAEERVGISDELILEIFKHNQEKNQQRIRQLNPEAFDKIIDEMNKRKSEVTDI